MTLSVNGCLVLYLCGLVMFWVTVPLPNPHLITHLAMLKTIKLQKMNF